MANISGVRTTGNILQQRRMVDMGRQIALLDPNEGTFVTFLKLAKKDSRVVYNPRFEWLEDDLLAGQSELSAAVSSATATTLSVDDALPPWRCAASARLRREYAGQRGG